MFNRRDILRTAGFGTLAAMLPGAVCANANTQSRFVLVIQRGAADGLSVAPPYADNDYRRLRRDIALPPPGSDGVLKLDGLFALNPGLAGFHEEFRAGRALIVHAVASPYRDRSHFDGQDVLENGASQVGALRDGWLNRALAPLGGSFGGEIAIAMAQNTPLVLRGENSATSWAPSQLPGAEENTIDRLQDLYAGDEFFATRLARALESQEIAAGDMDMKRSRRGGDAAQLRSMMQATARFLTAEDGPRIAVLETGGWDTHANQGSIQGTLVNRLRGLDNGLMALQAGLGDAWDRTVVAVVTEFGRTAAVNGTRGTDHGTASAALLVGGAVNGGRVVADWPGLRKTDLFEGRDLKPTTDMRSLFKGILRDHLSLPQGFLDSVVFPGSTATRPLDKLIRSG